MDDEKTEAQERFAVQADAAQPADGSQGDNPMALGMSDEYRTFAQKAVVRVCGIGGGGGNAVGRMIEAGMEDVHFITINTDAQALRRSPAGTRLQIGTAGLGAGARPEVARQAAEDAQDRIRDVLQGADMIFLTAGLGGGTGTGATPVVARMARETGALTVAIVTLPFTFEGGERMKNAMAGLEELQDKVDAVIVVPNDRLAVLCQENISFLNAFRQADEVLHNGVRAISELITLSGLINLDFADVRTIMEDSGRCLMGIGRAEGDDRALRAAEDAIVCPLLENSTIEGATRVIVNVHGGKDIGMREVHTAVSTVQRAAQDGANIIFGAVVDDEEQPEVKVTVIAAGFVHAEQRPITPFTEINIDSDPKTQTDADPAMEAAQPAETPAADNDPFGDPFEDPFKTPTTAGDVFGEMGAPGEQILLPEDDERDSVEPGDSDADGDEDFGIPAFLRRRMQQDRESSSVRGNGGRNA